jgi:hypothetical protein
MANWNLYGPLASKEILSSALINDIDAFLTKVPNFMDGSDHTTVAPVKLRGEFDIIGGKLDVTGAAGATAASIAGGTGNSIALYAAGSGTMPGISALGGATASGGVFVAGGGNKYGVEASGTNAGAGILATGGPTGNGGTFTAGLAGNGHGISATGTGTGAGVSGTGGVGGVGGVFVSGGTGAVGLTATGHTTGAGAAVTGGASAPGLIATPGTPSTAASPQCASKHAGFIEITSDDPVLGFAPPAARHTIYGLSVAKAWCNALVGGGPAPTINDEFNIQSITDVSTGIYEVTFTTSMPSTTYVVIPSLNILGRGITWGSKAPGTFRLTVFDTTTGAVVGLATLIDFVVYGRR